MSRFESSTATALDQRAGLPRVVGAGARGIMTHAHADQWSDDELLAAVIAGEVGAFETLYRRYFPLLASFAQQLTRSNAVAEELVQELFLSLWDRRRELKIDARSLRRYLFGSVRNAATDHLRRLRMQDRHTPDVVALTAPPPQADAALSRAELVDALARAIERLPERCRLIFLMRRQQGMTYAEIAESLDISPKTVDVQMSNAFRLLRKQLAAYWSDKDLQSS